MPHRHMISRWSICTLLLVAVHVVINAPLVAASRLGDEVISQPQSVPPLTADDQLLAGLDDAGLDAEADKILAAELGADSTGADALSAPARGTSSGSGLHPSSAAFAQSEGKTLSQPSQAKSDLAAQAKSEVAEAATAPKAIDNDVSKATAQLKAATAPNANDNDVSKATAQLKAADSASGPGSSGSGSGASDCGTAEDMEIAKLQTTQQDLDRKKDFVCEETKLKAQMHLHMLESKTAQQQLQKARADGGEARKKEREKEKKAAQQEAVEAMAKMMRVKKEEAAEAAASGAADAQQAAGGFGLNSTTTISPLTSQPPASASPSR